MAYKIGDRVKLHGKDVFDKFKEIEDGITESPNGIMVHPPMKKFLGSTGTIVHIYYNIPSYNIRMDGEDRGSGWAWCESCFSVRKKNNLFDIEKTAIEF